MHGLGFIHVNEWHWHAPTPGSSFACVTLRDGKAAIIGARSDMGIDTESGARLAVASEAGLKYEDTVMQERRSDNTQLPPLATGRFLWNMLHQYPADPRRQGIETENS